MWIRYIGHATAEIVADGVRILVDPWLTPRLDRFWDHFPPVASVVHQKLDAILISHHHFDHAHLPSLSRLNRDVVVFYPTPVDAKLLGPSGGGVYAVEWILNRLGFRQAIPVEPLSQFEFGSVRFTALPSAVPFPEVTFVIESEHGSIMLAGDSMLHVDAVNWFEQRSQPVDVALLPVHSVSNDACFRSRFPFKNRSDVPQHDLVRQVARLRFKSYLANISARVIIPSAFGWRAVPPPDFDEPDFGWMNHKLFPLTLFDGFSIGKSAGYEMRTWLPGDEIQIGSGGSIECSARDWTDPTSLKDLSSVFKYDQRLPLSPFEPEKIGATVTPAEFFEIAQFMRERLPELLEDTPVSKQTIDEPARFSLRVSSREEAVWSIECKGDKTMVTEGRRPDYGNYYVWIAARTLLRMIRADIPYANTCGHLIANNHLLDSIFNQPQFFKIYAEKVLSSASGVSAYGI